MAKFELRAVDENYTAAADAPSDQKLKGGLAAAIREGIRRQKARDAANRQAEEAAHKAHVQGVKEAHLDELNRSGRIVSRAAHRDGMLQGIVGGMLLAIGLAFATWVVLKEIVITNVSTQRVGLPGDGIPEFQEPPYDESYPRVNPREPGSAP